MLSARGKTESGYNCGRDRDCRPTYGTHRYFRPSPHVDLGLDSLAARVAATRMQKPSAQTVVDSPIAPGTPLCRWQTFALFAGRMS